MARFNQDDATRIYEIEQKLCTIQQGSRDVNAYYTELITLWENYKNYVELPVCTCGRCECNAAQLWERLQQRSRVTKFLMGLNEAYEPTRRHILMQKPMPSLEAAFNIVVQDERQKSINTVSQAGNVVFQSSGSSEFDQMIAYANYKGKPKVVCTHCGMTGHMVNKCYKIHGYPPGYIPGFKSQATQLYGQRPQQYSAQQFNTYPAKQFNAQQFQPKGNFQQMQRPVQVNAQQWRPSFPQKDNAIANVMIEAPPTPAQVTYNNIDLSSLTSDQVQQIVAQL